MSLTRRFALLLAAVLVPGLLGSVALHVLAARDTLQAQLQRHQQDVAATLGLALGGQPIAVLRARADEAFERGGWRRLTVLDTQGAVLLDRQNEARAPVPRWFASMMALEVEAAEAPIEADGQRIAQLRLQVGGGASSLPLLWRATERVALLMFLLVLAATLPAVWLLRGVRRALAAAVQQARAIEESRFVIADEPPQPDLREMTRAMNSMVRRLHQLFDAQAEQVTQLQAQVQSDAVTGLPVRSQFMGRIGAQLAGAAGPAGALLLARVPQLERLNERHGREATDRLLQSLADVLMTYVERVPGTCAGRLNGTDFGLFLPVTGIARETAQALRGALEANPSARLAGAEFLFGACDGLRGVDPGAALAATDAALARAEQGDGIAVIDMPEATPGGARAWREQLVDALAQGRVQIGSYPVVDRLGALIHLECPLRVQLDPEGEFQVARRWLALAARSRLLPEIDLTGVTLALAAIAEDGRPRCVHVAPHSMSNAGFGAALQSRLEAQREAAARLSIEWTESTREGAYEALALAAAGWRRLGVTIGIEHAGASPRSLPALKGLGLHYVKVDAQHLRGLAADEAVRGYAQSLLTLIHGVGLKAIAEGIDQPQDLQALWALGFDGATGAAVAAPTP